MNFCSFVACGYPTYLFELAPLDDVDVGSLKKFYPKTKFKTGRCLLFCSQIFAFRAKNYYSVIGSCNKTITETLNDLELMGFILTHSSRSASGTNVLLVHPGFCIIFVFIWQFKTNGSSIFLQKLVLDYFQGNELSIRILLVCKEQLSIYFLASYTFAMHAHRIENDIPLVPCLLDISTFFTTCDYSQFTLVLHCTVI